MVCSSCDKRNKACFYHVHVKFAYPFVAAVVSLKRERESKAEACILSIQEILSMCFSDVKFFHWHEKETTGFVVLYWKTKMTIMGKHKQAGSLSILAGWDCSWSKSLLYLLWLTVWQRRRWFFPLLFPLKPSLKAGGMSWVTHWGKMPVSWEDIRRTRVQFKTQGERTQTTLMPDYL